MKGRLFAVRRAAPAFCAFALSCSKGDQVTVRAVNLHAPASCPVPSGSYGKYTATGDFPLDATATSPLNLDAVGTTLDGIPTDARSLALGASSADQLVQLNAVTLVDPSGDVDMLVLPLARACPLSTNVGFFPGTPDVTGRLAVDMIAGAADAHTLLVLGLDQLPVGYRVDLDTGRVAKMATGIVTARTRAPLVATGDGGAIVAGGVSAATPIVLQSAEVYDPVLRDFDGRPITLAKQRADHAGVLLASGDVLLVGGQAGGTLIAEMEIVRVASRTSQLLGTQLSEPRTRPVALRLADGTILVGGGYLADGSPAQTVEFFSADAASRPRAPISLPMRDRHALVALDGGGALVVNVPDASDPPDFANTWNIPPDGNQGVRVTSVPNLTDARLFPANVSVGTKGRPVLWNGDRWLAFDPWNASQPWNAIDANSGVAGPASDSPIATPDPGLLAWVGEDGNVQVRRVSTRNAFATDPPYLASSSSSTDGMVPDRWAPTMLFDSSLLVPPATSAFVADARFVDVTVDVDAPSDGLPHIVLRGEFGEEVEIGGASCAFVQPPLPAHLHVERRGSAVGFRIGASAAPLMSCAGVLFGASERVAVGVRAGASGPARAKSLQVSR